MTLRGNEKKLKPYWKILFRFIVSLALIIGLSTTVDWHKLIKSLQESNLFYLFLSFVAIQITVMASVWKWQLLVKAAKNNEGKRDVSLVDLGRLYYIGLFFNNFLPSSVGGDVVRIFSLGKRIGMSRSATSVAVERLTSGIALVIILLGSASLVKSARPFMNSILILAGMFLLLFIILWLFMRNSERDLPTLENSNASSLIEKIKKKLMIVTIKIGMVVGDYRKQSWQWWVLVAILSFAFQLGLVWINDLLFIAFNINVPWASLLVIITLISAVTMLPFSINGIGVREVSYVFFFKQLGIADEIAVSVSLLFFLLVSLSSLFGGIFWLTERGK